MTAAGGTNGMGVVFKFQECTNPIVSYSESTNIVCLTYGAFTLTAATPAGGIYSGTGVTGNSFNPTTGRHRHT